VRELQAGLWHWQSPHPEWRPGQRWPQDVSSCAIDEGGRLLLFDPLAVPSEIEELAVGSEAVVVLTCPWHERDARSLAERLGAPVFTPAPDDGSPDVAWLVGGDRNDAHLYSAGDRLPVGVEALPGRLPNDVVLWMESRRAVIAGDTLVDFGQGLEVPVEWLP
jgi:glyoxylase-like metal-dependent hydrolase (beta-lactamase superfamily II)